ncbi:GAF and ANTAR domain-containing protein [Mycetocola zhadangensis]|uniref:GAF and ANTAR domain-containing protein n=1 Tax=Mycetocola zhadangensis TaxID=1164595 RepID=UPI003A4E6686
MPEHFARAMKDLTHNDGAGADLSRPFVDALPVTGAAVSTLGALLGTETVSATNSQAAKLDELQFDLGEGPCWDAMNSAQPVLEPDLIHRPSRAWPAFSDAIRKEDVGAIFAFPMLVGSLRLGAVDLYSSTPRELTSLDTQRSAALTSVVSRLVLRRALAKFEQPEPEDAVSPYFRRAFHQATGMVLAQLDISPDDAKLVIQAHAFSAGRSVQEVSEDILARKLDFSASTDSAGGNND